MTKTTVKKGQIFGQIFNQPLNSTSDGKVLIGVRNFISHNTKFSIFTPNPEIILRAYRDNNYARVLLSSDFFLFDGVGFFWGFYFLHLKRVKNQLLAPFLYLFQVIFTYLVLLFTPKLVLKEGRPIKGRKFMLRLINEAYKEGWKVFLLGNNDSAALSLAKVKEKYSSLEAYAENGPDLNEKGFPSSPQEERKEKQILEKINSVKPDLVFVGFGAPKQEYWIVRNLPKMNALGAMAIGGALDYLSGKAILPPKGFKKANLEWLWRLIVEPRRLVRIYNAVFKFPFELYLYKVRNN